MAAGAHISIGLLHRQDAGRVGPGSSFGCTNSAPHASTTKSAPAPLRRPPESRPPVHSAVWSGQVDSARTRSMRRVAFDVGIEHVRRADLHARHRAAPLIGSIAMIVDAPAMRAPCTALRPSGPQPTTATIEPGATVASVPRRRRAEAGDADAAAHHAEVHGARLGEDRHDPFLERHHQLGEAADVRVRVDGRAVAQIGDRHEIVSADCAQELAHVGAAAQAAIAGAALRRARHADAIADLHAPHFGSDGFDDADAAVSLDERPCRWR